MNCFNGQAYLKESLNSLLEQTYPHWELIFWDNQSTDKSKEIVRSYKDLRIRYFMAPKHSNLGVARGLALSKSKGEWIGFLDVDDLWHKNKLSIQINKIKNSNKKIGMIYGRCKNFLYTKSNNGKLKKSYKIRPGGLLPEKNLSYQLYLGNLVPFPSVLYSREALKSIGGIPPYEFAPDYYMALAIASKFEALATQEVICSYRIHDKSMSKRYREIGYLDSIKITKSIAPKKNQALFTSYNRMRLLLFYILNFELSKAKSIYSDLGFGYAVWGLIGLAYYKIKYASR